MDVRYRILPRVKSLQTHRVVDVTNDKQITAWKKNPQKLEQMVYFPIGWISHVEKEKKK